MKTENSVILRQAREALSGNWGVAIGAFVVVMIVGAAAGIVPFGSLFIAGPLQLGAAIFSLSIIRNRDGSVDQMFQGFNKFGTALGAYLLSFLFIFLWLLLLIIPGIIAAISYSMTFYIIADDDSIGAMDAIDKSKKMMDGNKWKFFTMGLRFFGLAILCLFTLGIGFLWLIPYVNISIARFYEDIKGEEEGYKMSEANILDDQIN
jgi:uncharacterized membrane protein